MTPSNTMETTATSTDDVPFRDRVRRNPGPAVVWVAGIVLLVALEFGAMAQFGLNSFATVLGVLPGEIGVSFLHSLANTAGELPTLLSRSLIDNRGYQLPSGAWQGTTLGLSPKHAWMLRVGLIYGYAFAFLTWCWRGYETFRTHYRAADWTPADDQIDRMRTHNWGRLGLVIVVAFLVLAVFAPAVAPTTIEQNIQDPYSHTLEYYNGESGQVEEVTIGTANLGSKSEGAGGNVGPWTYDAYDRFHPFGTLTSGKDLFTFLAHGARISLFIALSAMTVAGLIAVTLALTTAYYKGLLDLVVVLASDSVQALPSLMLILIAAVVFRSHWIAEVYNGGALLAALFALVYWPGLWRAVRGPAFQVSEEEWIDAAKSFGQRSWVTMEKHMLPYILGYLLVYGSMSIGGVIIGTAGLSFLGLGVSAPTPEWGRAVSIGQNYVATSSWHISLIPGILITIVVTGLNALGDGIRDAIDPQSEGGGSEEATATGGGA